MSSAVTRYILCVIAAFFALVDVTINVYINGNTNQGTKCGKSAHNAPRFSRGLFGNTFELKNGEPCATRPSAFKRASITVAFFL